MFRIPGIPVHNSGDGGGGGRRQTKPYRHPSPFITYNDKINHDEEESYDGDTKSLLTNHWVNVHANSFQPIVRENLTPPANSPLLYVPTREVVMDTRAGMSDEEEEDTTPLKKDDEDTPPPKDDDDDADNEVDSILKDERLQQRYDQRRKYKRQRSRSRMSMVCGGGGRKTPAGRAKRRRPLNNDGPVQLEIKNTNKPSILSSIMKYAKYPVYVSSNIMSVYLVLSYMGVDVSQYTANLTRVSTSLLRHINSAAAGGGAMADVLGRLTPGALMNASERLVAPLAASLAALK